MRIFNASTHSQCSFAGSIDFYYDAMYRYHPFRYPIPDDYGLHAVNGQINEYPRTPGEQICRDHFYSRFSILVKFRAEERMRFTLLNISDESGDKFSVVIDMIENSVTVAFSDCEILQLELPLQESNRINVGQWHRIGVAVDPDFIALYKDCENVYTYPYRSNCTVVCDESIELGVLEGKHNVMHFKSMHFKSHVHMSYNLLNCREQ